MSNLPLINRKIKSVTVTSKITNALKVVSSNHSSMYKDFQKRSLDYMQGVYRIFFELFNDPDHDIRSTNKHFISLEGNKNELCVVLGTDVGMCGDLNEKLKKYVIGNFNPGDSGLVVIGKKIFASLEKDFSRSIEKNLKSELEFINAPNRIREIAMDVIDIFMKKSYKKLTMVYLKDPKLGIIEKLNILPFTEKYFSGKKRIFIKSLETNVKYPDIILDIFPQYLECIIMGAFINSKLGEHNIRRELMYNATKNANNLLDEYKLTFNKIRQANITREITEIVVSVKTRKK